MSDKINQDDMKDVAGGIGDKPICKCPNCSGTDFTTNTVAYFAHSRIVKCICKACGTSWANSYSNSYNDSNLS